jgi:nuclear transport factor 2 (NTF2) superfamily protein
MRKRIASINEAPIDESERRISVPEAGLYKLNAVDP